MARFFNGTQGFGKTSNWHLRNLNWLSYSELFEYCTAKFVYSLINSDSDHYLKHDILKNRRGRNLTNNKLGPINDTLGRHAATQATFAYYSVKIYNSLPPTLTLVSKKQIFKKYAKKYFLNKNEKIKPKCDQITKIENSNIEIDLPCPQEEHPPGPVHSDDPQGPNPFDDPPGPVACDDPPGPVTSDNTLSLTVTNTLLSQSRI